VRHDCAGGRSGASAAEGPLSPDDTVDVWSRGCAWQASGMTVTMVVQGALISDGNAVIGASLL
jgi:hypothetical protein